MDNPGSIVCHTRSLPFGGRYTSYSWDGGDVTMIDGYLLDCIPNVGETFWIGPFLLRALDYRAWEDRLVACRERPLIARARYAAYRVTRTLDRIYRLSIITLYVWGLARYDRARAPSWRDVKGIDRLFPSE